MKYILEYQDYRKYNNFNDSFIEWFGDSQIVNIKGFPLKVYHQTSKEAEQEILKKGFDISKGRARLSDHIVPDGYFFKDTPNDIGLGSDDPVQMEFYLSIQNPLEVLDRKDFVYKLCKLSSEYCKAYQEYEDRDKKYNKDFEILHKEATVSRGIYKEYQPRIQAHLDEWKNHSVEGATKLRSLLTKTLIDNNYDGVIFERDQGSWGRVTKTYIALYPYQIKRTDNKTFTKSNLVTERKQLGTLYHFTSLVNLYYIITYNQLESNREVSENELDKVFKSPRVKYKNAFSFTRNKNLPKVIGQNQIDTILSCRIDFDGNSLSDKYLIKPYNWQHESDISNLNKMKKGEEFFPPSKAHTNEYEEVLLHDDSYVKNIQKYITALYIPNKEEFVEEFIFYIESDYHLYNRLEGIIELSGATKKFDLEDLEADREYPEELVPYIYDFIINTLDDYTYLQLNHTDIIKYSL